MSTSPAAAPIRRSIYPSKIDTWLAVVMAVAGVIVLIACWRAIAEAAPGAWLIPVLVVALSAALPISLIAATRYTLDDEQLHIRSGPFAWTVPVREITAVTPTRNPLSSPALSLDRLRIDYGRGRSIMISPRDKQAFLRDLDDRRRKGR